MTTKKERLERDLKKLDDLGYPELARRLAEYVTAAEKHWEGIIRGLMLSERDLKLAVEKAEQERDAWRYRAYEAIRSRNNAIGERG
jgi:hypothetical protein